MEQYKNMKITFCNLTKISIRTISYNALGCVHAYKKPNIKVKKNHKRYKFAYNQTTHFYQKIIVSTKSDNVYFVVLKATFNKKKGTELYQKDQSVTKSIKQIQSCINCTKKKIIIKKYSW